MGLDVRGTFTNALNETGISGFEARYVTIWSFIVVLSMGADNQAMWMVDWA
jgi:hypothetical protein